MLLLICKSKKNNTSDLLEKQLEEGGAQTLLTVIASPEFIEVAPVASPQSIAVASLEFITRASPESIGTERAS
jgi:hypothetical protein